MIAGEKFYNCWIFSTPLKSLTPLNTIEWKMFATMKVWKIHFNVFKRHDLKQNEQKVQLLSTGSANNLILIEQKENIVIKTLKTFSTSTICFHSFLNGLFFKIQNCLYGRYGDTFYYHQVLFSIFVLFAFFTFISVIK